MRRRRKIDDKKLLELLESGKSQKECAEFFQTSPSSVCQRVQRLLPQMPESFEVLTPQQQQFCLSIAEGKSRIDSAMEAYEVTTRGSAKTMACRLLGEPDIQTAISDLMNHHGLTRSYRVQKLKRHVDNRNPDVSLRALDQSWKLSGDYAPEKSMNLNVNVEVSDDEVEKLREMAKKIAEEAVKKSNKGVIEIHNEQENNGNEE